MQKNYDFFDSFYFFDENLDLNSNNFEENKNNENVNFQIEFKNDFLTNEEEKIENILNKKRNLIDEKTKKQIKLIKNRESAKKSRLKMKKIFNNLKEENKLLKMEIQNLKNENQKYSNFIEKHLCKQCLEKYNKESKKLFIVYNDNNNNNNNPINSNNSNNLNFSSLTSIISVILCIFILLFLNLNSQHKFGLKNKRLLKENEKYSDIPLSTFYNKSNYENKTFILMSDYYSFSHININNFLGEKLYRFENKGKIKIIKDIDSYDNFFKNSKSCVNCIIEVSNDYITQNKVDPLQFQLYIPSNNILNYVNNKEIEFGYLPNSNFIEVSCKVLGYKIGKIKKNFL